MGEHGTWFDFLNRFSFWQTLMEKADNLLGRKKPMLLVFQESHFTLTHVLVTMLVLAFVIYGALQFKAGLATSDGGLVPPRRMSIRNLFEVTAESVYGMVEGAMGAHNAPRFFPLVGALWMFILFGNLIGLVPGFISPTTRSRPTSRSPAPSSWPPTSTASRSTASRTSSTSSARPPRSRRSCCPSSWSATSPAPSR